MKWNKKNKALLLASFLLNLSSCICSASVEVSVSGRFLFFSWPLDLSNGCGISIMSFQCSMLMRWGRSYERFFFARRRLLFCAWNMNSKAFDGSLLNRPSARSCRLMWSSLSVYISLFFLERHFSFSVPPLEEVDRLGHRSSNTSPSYRNELRGRKLRFCKGYPGDYCFAYSLYDSSGSRSQKLFDAVNKAVLPTTGQLGK